MGNLGEKIGKSLGIPDEDLEVVRQGGATRYHEGPHSLIQGPCSLSGDCTASSRDHMALYRSHTASYTGHTAS